MIAGWFGAAAVAVLVGLLAVDIIGDGLTSSSARPMSRAEVARELAAAPSSSAAPSAAPSAATSAAPSASAALGGPPAPRSFSTRGGTVVVRCRAGNAEIVSMSPRPGFEQHEQEGDEGEFRGVSDNHDRVRIDATCSGGVPSIATRDERED